MDIDELLKYAAKYGASDLHITANNPPIIRVNGRLKRIPGPALTQEEVKALIFAILTEDQRPKLEQKRELDLSYAWSKVTPYIKLDYQSVDRVRARVNIFREINGIGAAFRIIPARIRPLDELPAPESVKELTRQRKGLVLVTGPTG